MAIKYVCDKCNKDFDTYNELSLISFKPAEKYKFVVHRVNVDFILDHYEQEKEIKPMQILLCNECSSKILAGLFGSPVIANKL